VHRTICNIKARASSCAEGARQERTCGNPLPLCRQGCRLAPAPEPRAVGAA
jgi:hypothetical protein